MLVISPFLPSAAFSPAGFQIWKNKSFQLLFFVPFFIHIIVPSKSHKKDIPRNTSFQKCIIFLYVWNNIHLQFSNRGSEHRKWDTMSIKYKKKQHAKICLLGVRVMFYGSNLWKWTGQTHVFFFSFQNTTETTEYNTYKTIATQNWDVFN